MASTYLIVGSTGNTGVSVVETLSRLLPQSASTKDIRILAVTRSASGEAAKSLSQLPQVEVVEKDWTEIDATWLKQHDVRRAFIACHNSVSHFTDEAKLCTALLHAGAEYLVRISTTDANTRPDSPVYYGRNHWAVENLLAQPAFAPLKWSSLRPNIWSNFYLQSAAAWIRQFRTTGRQEPLPLMAAADVPVAMVHPVDVGHVAGVWLAPQVISERTLGVHVLNGPEDITGEGIVELVRKHAGVVPEKVEYQSMTMFRQLIQQGFPKNVWASLEIAPRIYWEGKCSLKTAPTSEVVLDLARPTRTPAATLEEVLQS